jgi:hypothetical protein
LNSNDPVLDVVGIKIAVIPIEDISVAGTLRIGDGLQKGRVTLWAADVFRWAPAFSLDKAGIASGGATLGNGLNVDPVPPFGIEVIKVVELLDAFGDYVAEAQALGAINA